MKKITITLSFSFLCFITFLVSCSNKSDKQKDTGNQADTGKVVNNPPASTKPAEPTLICKNVAVDSIMPQFELSLLADGKEIKIKTINNCSLIDSSDYKRYEIPEDAICARGGWYAGGGDYYYIVKRNGKLSVFEGWDEEQQEDKGYHWKEISVK
jgi:hypothetical protein